MKTYLAERLTFDQLFRLSEPKRVRRSDTVRGPPLQINAHTDSIYHTFNFKSFPSTTGLRHHGYIRFFKPSGKSGNQTPLQHLPCEVDCTCPDFRYRWAWVLKQKGSSRVGSRSMNQAWNKAPWKTNPQQRVSLCKHILAARDYIYGLMGGFGRTLDTGEFLDTLVQYANRRWNDWEGQSANAKEREKWYRAAKAARAAGKPVPPGPPALYRPPALKPAPEVPVRPLAPSREKAPALPNAGVPAVPPLAVPPGERGRGLPPIKRPGPPPAGPGRRESLETGVSRVNGQLMREVMNLNEAIQVVEKLRDEVAVAAPLKTASAADALPPSETPTSDAAVGADTEGNVVLQLLTDIKNLLSALVAAETDSSEEEPSAEEPEDEEAGLDAIPEPPEPDETEDQAQNPTAAARD